MTVSFNPTEFDDWAATYDAETLLGGFPFDGYERVLETITLAVEPTGDVLDLGAGTGSLSARIAARGPRLWCLDFSPKMLEIAQRRLPQARFAQADLRDAWPAAFQRRYHAVVSAYTFHHFVLEEKIDLVRRLLRDHLLRGGRIVIGDISFPNIAALDAARREAGPAWDEEYYWLADETLPALGGRARYTQISSCAGVYVIEG
jgi:putative AdoMet-dependent methyltransferase